MRDISSIDSSLDDADQPRESSEKLLTETVNSLFGINRLYQMVAESKLGRGCRNFYDHMKKQAYVIDSHELAEYKERRTGERLGESYRKTST